MLAPLAPPISFSDTLKITWGQSWPLLMAQAANMLAIPRAVTN